MRQCDRCGDGTPAAFTRRYSGESLCAGCFTGSITRKTAKTISRHGMIRAGDRVAVAVSGGKDSLALLHVLHQMSEPHNFEIRAVTIDEGIPGYRDEALGIVRDYCGQLGVEYAVFSYRDLFGMTLEGALRQRGELKEAGKAGTSSCAICGTLRRRAMDHAAGRVGAGVLATAHNLDDNLQTGLINMLSGDVNKIGWAGPSVGGGGRKGGDANPRRIKPFSEIYESEIVFYAFTNGIPFQTEPCPHMGEGVRTEIREFLNSMEERRPGVKNGLYRSVEKISRAVRESGTKPRTRCSRCGAPCTGQTCSVCVITSKFGPKRA